MRRTDHSAAGGHLAAGALSIPGDRLWYLLEDNRLLYLGFAPPDAAGVRLPAALRRHLAGTRYADLPAPGSDTARQELQEYFSGSRTSFSLSLQPLGTDFQRRVWARLLELPYGATTSYGALAQAAGCPGASRAAGTAVGTNPIAIVIPCHRVLPAGGGVGNYGGGQDRKIRLLKLEGALPGRL